tara:strand:- start:304 stop:534 length:231 start_codon:yes stop_codon:yes gene_type:complete
MSQGICLGYIMGLTDAEVDMRTSFGVKTSCIPDEVQIPQLKEILIKYLKKYPEDWHYKTSSMFFISMMETFPCKEQ